MNHADTALYAAPETVASNDGRRATETQAFRIRLVFSLTAALAIMVKLFFYTGAILRDPDNWWQVKVGLDILANKALPVIDTYSYTFADHPWIAKEWLGQVLLAGGYEAFEWKGVVLVTISSIMLTLAALTWCLSARFKPLVAIGLAFLITMVAGAIFTARPLIFSLPIIVVWTAVLFDAARQQKPPPLWTLVLIVLWANLHGTFTFGFVIAAFAGLDCLSRVGLQQPRLIARWIGFGLLCPLVTLLNPYGAQAILATFTVASGNEAVPFIMEWSAFDAQTDHYSMAALMIVIAILLLARLQIRWTYAAFFLFTLYLFLAYARFQYLWLLLIPVVLASDIARQFPALSFARWLNEPRDRLETAIARHFRVICAGLACFWIAAMGIFLTVATVQPDDAHAAAGGLAYARDHQLSGPVMNSYNFGGSLIFHGIKTYIDGRTDQLFLGGFMNDTMTMGTSAGKALLQRDLAKYNIAWALLTPQDGRIPFFDELPGWRRGYADDTCVVYVRSP